MSFVLKNLCTYNVRVIIQMVSCLAPCPLTYVRYIRTGPVLTPPVVFQTTGFHFGEQSLSIGETSAEGNELGYETTAFAVTGV